MSIPYENIIAVVVGFEPRDKKDGGHDTDTGFPMTFEALCSHGGSHGYPTPILDNGIRVIVKNPAELRARLMEVVDKIAPAEGITK